MKPAMKAIEEHAPELLSNSDFALVPAEVSGEFIVGLESSVAIINVAVHPENKRVWVAPSAKNWGSVGETSVYELRCVRESRALPDLLPLRVEQELEALPSLIEMIEEVCATPDAWWAYAEAVVPLVRPEKWGPQEGERQWLQSYAAYDEVVRYDHRDGSYVLHSKEELSPDDGLEHSGSYEMLSGVFCARYIHARRLYLRIGELTIALEDDVVVQVEGKLSSRVLRVIKDGAELVALEYAVDESPFLPFDPTPHVNAEDFDFGLHLARISTDAARKHVALGYNL